MQWFKLALIQDTTKIDKNVHLQYRRKKSNTKMQKISFSSFTTNFLILSVCDIFIFINREINAWVFKLLALAAILLVKFKNVTCDLNFKSHRSRFFAFKTVNRNKCY